MTRLFNRPTSFLNETLDGFALAYPEHVERVVGASGFVRRGGPRPGKVSLLVGGGSGHYPSYSGVTGVGFADGSVLGEVFTSPSAEQIYRVGRAANGGAGLILAFGNYAGDRMNFASAAERLRKEGIDTRLVWVTDDVASADATDARSRRGVAGTFIVYKIGGAAAERGRTLDEVEQCMRRANQRTYSHGVAFAGCTLPGQSSPLFEVADDVMDFGLGIHGEPGVRTVPWMPAEQLAEALIRPILAERSFFGNRAAVLLNGLGSTKYEELFVLWAYLQPIFEDVGVEIVAPEIGEFVTSLDMAGCSLSVTWLDEELESLWTAPADTPSFRRGIAEKDCYQRYVSTAIDESGPLEKSESQESIKLAGDVRHLIDVATATVEKYETDLARIDAIAGDGDHGSGMVRGFRAARDAADHVVGGVDSVLLAAGQAFGDRAGGTSGILWGRFLETIGNTLGNSSRLDRKAIVRAIRAGADEMKIFGKAELGDKTMLDSLFPFVEALETSDSEDLSTAWFQAALVATQSALDTASLVPKVGRARPLASRSIGVPDAGATSMALIVSAVGDALPAMFIRENGDL